MKNFITLEDGNGGKEMQEFLETHIKNFYKNQNWKNTDEDSATFQLENKTHLCFTTDSFVVNPIIFPGGNIGDLAFAGTINDILMMGGQPIGISLALILEEGFENKTLEKILKTINNLSKKYQIPIVTGDTKVMEKGKLDKIVINTTSIGISKKILDASVEKGDKIIISGGIAEHGTALLSQRFDFETDIISDTKPLAKEMSEIKDLIKYAKDPTRGGISACLNEISQKKEATIEIWDKKIPIKKAVKTATSMLGIDPLSLANEGKLICITTPKNAETVLKKLKKLNKNAEIIGEVTQKKQHNKVTLKTDFGTRILSTPSGELVPRIC